MSAARSIASSLPEPPRPLIGRAGEFEAIERLRLDQQRRLISLTGPGGIGKTRLALELGARWRPRFPDGVAFVDLAPVTDPTLVGASIATALGMPDAGACGILESVGEWLHDRRVLLILDNFERVVPAATDVAWLLERCPDLLIVVTSRARLHLAEETEFAVPVLGRQAALDLFQARAEAARADFRLTDANATAVGDICARLDGIPLAIELAAARIKVLSAEQIAQRLQDYLRLLSGNDVDAPARHRTLQAALDWSFDQLGEAERALISRMSVFVGGATISAVEHVCNDGDVLDALANLVDQSLVTVSEHLGVARYRLLEPIRQYALERLRTAGKESLVTERYADWFLRFAEDAESELLGPAQMVVLDRLATEFTNLRAAIDWFRQRSAVDQALRLAGALWKFCEVRGHASEGGRWLDDALELDRNLEAQPEARSKALHGAANLAFVRGDYARTQALHEENLALRRRLGDTRGAGISLFHLASVLRSQGEADAALELCRQSLVIFRELGDRQWCANALNSMGIALADQRAFSAARAALDEALLLFRSLGGTRRIAIALGNLGDLARAEGDHDRADRHLRQSLELFHQLADAWGSGATLESLAQVACARGSADRAAELFGAAEAQLSEAGARLEPAEQPAHDRALATLRVRLGNDGLQKALERGRRLSRSDALALAQQIPTGPTTGEISYLRAPSPLTEREREVAALVARGLTNKQIADTLVISKQTADKHVANILGKLGVATRAQVAVWWVSYAGAPAAA